MQLAETLLPPTPGEAVGRPRRRARAAEGRHARASQTGPVVERVTSDVRLDRLPAITCWPEDGGPFITLPLVYTTHPDRPATTSACIGCRCYDARTTGMHWQIGKGGGFHYAVAEARGADAAGHGVSRRPAGADPVGHRAAARERAGVDAGVADRRRAPAAGRTATARIR